MTLEEQQLVKGCIECERKAQKALYDKYSRQMMSVCLRYVKETETARDLLQDGFILVFSNIDKYKGDGALDAWVRRIFVNCALEHLRKYDILKESIDIEDDMVSGMVDESTVSRMTAAELMDCVGSLPEGYRTVFNLFAVEGYSHKEIGEMIGISENTSRSQYMRARQKLREMISEKEIY
ncbi:MAG: sigma-70 family RNA polymerase sigma factor [Tannerella sp.]|jgi:RNA polymerase sigma-70 factor (ECF subfamily)|nr:sigma-70 family RNA polymerase sigma factor [Tannerella sp.]